MPKRGRDQADLPERPAKLARSDSGILLAEAHPDLPAGAEVRLRPLLSLGQDNKINGIQISGRTPSPFGRPMGDHTVAWQAVIDAVHASLHGLTLPAAIEELRDLQAAAADWMNTRGSAGMLLLSQLGADIAARRPRLEDAAFGTTDHLDRADAALTAAKPAAALDELAKAIAYHLTYLNYLPFATVPAESARGSHGSAEGFHRKTLTDYERSGQVDPNAPPLAGDDGVGADLHRSLWALFDFAAALRESDIEYVLAPSSADLAVSHAGELKSLVDGMQSLADGLARQRLGVLSTDESKKLEGIRAAAERIGTKSPYVAIRTAAGRVKDQANAILGSRAETRASTRKKLAAKAASEAALALAEAELAAAAVKSASAAAADRAALVLSALLHKHQQTVATAYPRSVTACGFLGSDPVAAALAAVEVALLESPDLAGLMRTDAVTEAVTSLTGRIGEMHAALGPVTVAASNAWVTAAGQEPLVVSYDPAAREGMQLTVNGRAAAPVGIQGMGSHTTAWVLEVQAVNALVSEGASDEEARQALSAAVTYDLTLDVLTLDELLPADQLEGGQLAELFSAAAGVTDATDAGSAARSFLEFRNLFPFATVDAGERGGHAESADAAVEVLFDKGSLEHAADLVSEALSTEVSRKRASKALRAAADQLDDEAARTDEDAWPEDVKAAARVSAMRLSAWSAALEQALLATSAPGALAEALAEAKEAAPTIWLSRWAEHERVYKLIHPDYQSQPYPADADISDPEA